MKMVWRGGRSEEGVSTFSSVPWQQRRRRKVWELPIVVRWKVAGSQCGVEIEVRVERGKVGMLPNITSSDNDDNPYPPILSVLRMNHTNPTIFLGQTVIVYTEEVEASATFLIRQGADTTYRGWLRIRREGSSGWDGVLGGTVNRRAGSPFVVG